MKCINRHASYASWRLDVFRQLFVPSPNCAAGTRTLRRNFSSTSFRFAANKKKPGEGKNLSSTPKPKAQSPSQLLPQSPLLKHPPPGREKKRKRRPKLEEVEGLRTNPWAMALASPLRMCVTSTNRLPRYFLEDFGLVQHPVSSDPDCENPGSEKLFFLPVDLLREELQDSVRNSAAPPLRLLKLRVASHYPLLKEMTDFIHRGTSEKKPRVSKFIPFRWRHPIGALTGRDEQRMVWREDMPEFVLRAMRKDVVKKLKRASWLHRNGDPDGVLREIGLDDFSQAALAAGLKNMEKLERAECGAVLIIGPPQKRGKTAASNGSDIPNYVILPQTQTLVPVLDLSFLLSEAELEDLRKYQPLFGSNALFFRPNNKVDVEAILAVWKLNGFVQRQKL